MPTHPEPSLADLERRVDEIEERQRITKIQLQGRDDDLENYPGVISRINRIEEAVEKFASAVKWLVGLVAAESAALGGGVLLWWITKGN